MTNRDDLADLLASIYASFAGGDVSTFADRLADDATMIGTDEAEWWDSKAAALPVIQSQLEEMGEAGISLAGGDAVFGERGDVVWAADRPTMTLPDGTTASLRATVVAVREGDRLVVKQMHLSAPAPNEELVQTSLTV